MAVASVLLEPLSADEAGGCKKRMPTNQLGPNRVCPGNCGQDALCEIVPPDFGGRAAACDSNQSSGVQVRNLPVDRECGRRRLRGKTSLDRAAGSIDFPAAPAFNAESEGEGPRRRIRGKQFVMEMVRPPGFFLANARDQRAMYTAVPLTGCSSERVSCPHVAQPSPVTGVLGEKRGAEDKGIVEGDGVVPRIVGQETLPQCVVAGAFSGVGEQTSDQSGGKQAPEESEGDNGKTLKIFFGNPDRWGPTAEGFLSTHGGQVWGIAEHHMQTEQLEIVKKRLKQHRVYAEPAALTGKSQAGTHAGVMLLMRAPLLALPLPSDVLGKVAPRIDGEARRWVAGTLRVRGCTLLILTVYLFTGLSLHAPENVNVMMQIGLLLKLFRLPAVIMGDFQNTPEQMLQSQWVTRLGLELKIPQGMSYTCKQGQGRIIDYFLVTAALGEAVRACEVVTEVPWRNHFVVALELAVRAKNAWTWVPVVPKPLPKHPPEFNQELWEQAGGKANESFDARGDNNGKCLAISPGPAGNWSVMF